MRNKWVAKFVFGDGNCAWRALAMAIWGTDVYWVQLKLVVLAWSVANTELLLAEGRALYDDTKFFTDEIHSRYGRFEQGDDVSTSDNRFEMLIASVEYYTTDKTWGSDLTMLMASQAPRIPVKMLNPMDKKSRDEYDAQDSQPLHGLGRKGDDMGDYRHSQVFVPDEAALVYRGVGPGENALVVEEAAVALTDGYRQAGSSELADIAEINRNTICG
ncbi:unnamed protein product [Pylaiella littoralis]